MSLTEIKRLSALVAGTTIVPNEQAEGLFSLRRGEHNFDVRVFGSDLGWRFKVAGNKPP